MPGYVRAWSRLAYTVAILLGVLGWLANGSAPLGAFGGADSRDRVVVNTASGPIVGTIGEGYRLFQGIPYAAPPVGEWRWQSPQPVQPWTEPLDATSPGNRCPQVVNPTTGEVAGDEDCLVLAITAPAAASADQPRPVMVWLHGAGAGQGAASDFDARRLAIAGDVVVVTVNYRLGVFGFFGYPGLDGSGGFGLEDQQVALRWVQQNIAAFGGDPTLVTLFGESSGGMNTCGHLTSPTAEGLFQRAIIQSGSCLTYFPANSMFPDTPASSIWSTLEDRHGLGAALAEAAGCAGDETAISCLRELPAAEVLQQPLAMAFGSAAYGNEVLPRNPADALREGRFHRVPVMIGVNHEEASYFAAGFVDPPITAETYPELVREAFGDHADAVLQQYPLDAYAAPPLAWAAVSTDRAWVCPTLETARLLAAHVPTYVYEFADADAPLLFPEPAFPIGAYHGAEVPYLFDIAGLEATLSPEQHQLSVTMIGYWSTFALAGDPNASGLPDWPPFEPGSGEYVQSLAPGPDGIGPVDLGAEHRCAFWAGVEREGQAPAS